MVRRYAEHYDGLQNSQDGGWVIYDDYAALQAEYSMLQSVVAGLEEKVGSMGDKIESLQWEIIEASER